MVYCRPGGIFECAHGHLLLPLRSQLQTFFLSAIRTYCNVFGWDQTVKPTSDICGSINPSRKILFLTILKQFINKFAWKMVAIKNQHIIFKRSIFVCKLFKNWPNISVKIDLFIFCLFSFKKLLRGQFANQNCLFVGKSAMLFWFILINPCSFYCCVSTVRKFFPTDFNSWMVNPEPKNICTFLIAGLLNIVNV